MRKSPEPLETLRRFKQNHPEQCRQTVVACRVDLAAPMSSAISRKAERAHKVGQFIQAVRMPLTVQERCGVVHLKKPQYIAHMQFVEGMSKVEA